MPVWAWVLLFAACIKLPIAAAMLWLPMRYDNSLVEAEGDGSSEDDGGSHALPGGPLDPHPREPSPRRPRRGPHGNPGPSSPPRVRRPARAPIRTAHLF
ncbi:MAG TPA: hypothetical protein VMA83_06715 [Solirubrobacteraceae bacterium]|nr:hypothetical protein [Solirubrobacteraceae bacterium]